MMVFTLTGTDPALNLALEEHLLETPPPGVGGGPLLLLYENSEAVIIGKNQNPWLEVPPAAPARGSPPSTAVFPAAGRSTTAGGT